MSTRSLQRTSNNLGMWFWILALIVSGVSTFRQEPSLVMGFAGPCLRQGLRPQVLGGFLGMLDRVDQDMTISLYFQAIPKVHGSLSGTAKAAEICFWWNVVPQFDIIRLKLRLSSGFRGIMDLPPPSR
uniref:Uncharacterized protein n=1 Tax=Moniliophthora roreri TaxID=221103 RepID=A0A0W0F4W8_MONRR